MSAIGAFLNNRLRKIGFEVRRVGPVDDSRLYRGYYNESSLRDKRFYNIGAGLFYHQYWTNVDLASDWYSLNQQHEFLNFKLESLERLPVEDGCAEIVYSSHTIEHITDAAARNMFDESYRILKRGGVIRLTTPNIDIEYAAYMSGDRDYFYWIDEYSTPGRYEHVYRIPLSDASIQQIFLSHFASQVSELHPNDSTIKFSDEEIDEIFLTMDCEDALNYFTSRCSLEIHRKFAGNHINWWNEAKLSRMLRDAGFTEIRKSGYGQSYAPPLRSIEYFDSTHPKLSLYMEAVK